jgi:hypothetical protein
LPSRGEKCLERILVNLIHPRKTLNLCGDMPKKKAGIR